MLPTPSSLKVTSAAHHSINLQWHYERRDVEFVVNVFYSDGSFVKDQVVRGTSATVEGLAPSTNYQFSVKAAKALPHGQRANSADSERVTARTQELALPTPANLRATSGGQDHINLAWQYERDDVEFVVNVFYSDGSFVKDQVVRGTSATVEGLAPSTSYQFSVKAAKALSHGQRANSADSERVTARTQGTPPAQPPRPPTTTTPAPRPPTTHTTPPPQPAPPTSPPPTPAAPSVGDRCRSEGLCVCPPPHQHVCAPCDMINTCSKIADDGVCSTEPPAGSAGMTVSVLSCGSQQPILNVEGVLRANGGVKCDSGKVPAHTVALVECWGSITVLVECQTDGTWRPYGDHQSHAPSDSHLCQFEYVNSPLCGHRPPFQDAGGVAVFPRPLPHWPWLAGLFLLESYICTATIISRQFLLTAAHCVTRYPPPLVRLEEPITYSYHVYPALAATFNRTSLRYSWDLLPQGPDSRCHAPHDDCASSIDLDEDQFCATDSACPMGPPFRQNRGNFRAQKVFGCPYLVNVGNDAVEQWVVAGLISSSYSLTSCARPVTICTSLAAFWPWISKCKTKGKRNCWENGAIFWESSLRQQLVMDNMLRPV
ncbi:LOW QUALITY PROTEIN: uncharacterized protein [Panulirus ornatus]|uniref:LOW QUALITY PROTEIN: uncharacterized protein n=1 Tax=Panulirus ornatus TaxID=150431 RepID=UPI003A84C384